MSHTNLLQWSNSIRFLIANDSGRESFQQQINTHGFLFLDDYLNNILVKPKQDALIDLVKTPSRQKNHIQISKIKNPSPSKLNRVMSLEDDGDKENASPVNNFHKALLQAREKEDQPRLPTAPLEVPVTPHPTQDSSISAHEPNSYTLVTPVVSVTSTEDPTEVAEHYAPLELSVIAEDDELADRSRMSSHPSPEKFTQSPTKTQDLPDVVEQETSTNAAVQPSNPNDSMHTADAILPLADTFHAIPSESALVPLLPTVDETDTQHVTQEVTAEIEVERKSTEDAQTEQNDPTLSLAGTKGEDHTSTIPVFPSLPAPIPIRKSVRVLSETSAEPGFLGAFTPAAAITKRTSWLMKSREVKALESVNGKATNFATVSTHVTTIPGVPSKRKSDDMLGAGVPGMARQDEGERAAKVAKKVDTDMIPRKVGEEERPETPTEAANEGDEFTQVLEPQGGEQKGMLDQFKRTVEGLGARFGKSTGKSMGGGLISNALAEARAAAEAKVAERNRRDEDVMMDGPSLSKLLGTNEPVSEPPSTGSSLQQADLSTQGVEVVAVDLPSQPCHSRLSVSDLALPEDSKEQDSERKNILSLFPPEHENKLLSQTNKPSSTTPVSPFGKLFDKTSPVFIPPSLPPATSKPAQPVSPRLASTKPPSITVGLSPRLPASPPMGQQKRPPLSAQSTWESLKSEASERVFSSQEPPAWMPSSQDTEYSAAYEAQPQRFTQSDEDDSWPIDGKLGEKIKQWPFGMTLNNDRDSLTWSSAPTDSQKLNTNVDEMEVTEDHSQGPVTHDHNVPGSYCMDMDDEEESADKDADMSIDNVKPTVSFVESTVPQQDRSIPLSSSQTEEQSQPSQGGFFGHATKLVSNVLGTNKKPKAEVKSLQLAAAAAKKQQEEKDKKATVLKNMESRRQLVLQKKVEEERTRQLEEERKMKEEAERRKREREEHTGKILVKPAAKKEDDLTGKRKIELKKPVAGGLNSSASSKPTFKPAIKSTPSTVSVVGSSSIGMPPANSVSKMKAKTPAKGEDDDFAQPSQVVQNQMSARAKAQIQASKQTESVIPSESIELPEINSEYSDSDDEDRKRAFDPPDWAQSPELRQALQMQSTINPDEIFGAIQPLRMEEIFRNGRTSRFRPRSSSANWNGTDRLTAEEERDYARRMGFR
ncbi:hypothetical protein E1B28_001069 [Marasmius oreades]|uniref:Inner centromere protein ARK-binding domain-containing protein n=1 Tax=Marasmius oreades TaxID=181124 RepID=A0A9P7V2V6_9AGAR|nr:uncharacterized protein E1B28_001069 [Marasmius oreades]KAG7099202.1 hypothetical protein E1B28_001069 [Marasmius oreades]